MNPIYLVFWDELVFFTVSAFFEDTYIVHFHQQNSALLMQVWDLQECVFACKRKAIAADPPSIVERCSSNDAGRDWMMNECRTCRSHCLAEMDFPTDRNAFSDTSVSENWFGARYNYLVLPMAEKWK